MAGPRGGRAGDPTAPTPWPSRWPSGLAWVLWALAMLGLAVFVWPDQLLRQAARPELVA